MSELWIHESFVNATKNIRFSETPWSKTRFDSLGQLYRSLSAEYGRCISRIYVDPSPEAIAKMNDLGVDRAMAEPKAVGWVFLKRMEYEGARRDWSDDRRFYLREVWVEVSDTPRNG